MWPAFPSARSYARLPARSSRAPRRPVTVVAGLLLGAAALACLTPSSHLGAWLVSPGSCQRSAVSGPSTRAGELAGARAAPRPRGRAVARGSWLDMLEEAVGVPTPEAASPPIPATVSPLAPGLVHGELTAYMLEEKAMSMSGEDFEVKSPEGEVLLKIGGGNKIPIPGMPVWDKLTVSTPSGETLAVLDRQAIALTTTYDVLRPDGSKFGKIDKAMFALTQTFELWQEGDGQPGPLLKAEGSFSERNYVLKCHQGNIVATVARLKGFGGGGNVDNYQVIIGPNVDASLVLAMAVVIDEVHDEENKDNEASAEGLADKLEDAAGLPMPQTAVPAIPSFMPPLDAELMHGTVTAYELEEKALSFSGEDFDVKSPTGDLLLRVGGGNRVPIAGMPVWDKLTVSSPSGAQIATLDRELISMTPTYDVFRADGAKFGKISKAMFGFSETFELYLDGDPAGGPALKAEGTFSERKYTFKSREGTVVAAVGRGYFQTENENKYHVLVGPQVDASLVLAMAVAIDEVHDEENKDEGEGGGGFPFR
uniref:Uncharacterized protein n=1 Tax=Pyrodinium bahamense TaxID=73915 RepID=A0A7S0A9E2_9DINO|mmetsp:Transcript_2838/g.7884  ORF Transcript_2838/g.7884 Transcript_2838/m.7884 type:complete len:538 (+) Transcript_2838:94-1707(+)